MAPRDERSGRDRGRGDGPRTTRSPELALPDDIMASQLDPQVRRDLLSLDRLNADAVARHLVMAGSLVDDDAPAALAHARAARDRAARVAAVREAVGIAAYHAGEWAEAVAELRAARRMAGGPGLVAVLADCERALGRPLRALELGRSPEARSLDPQQQVELKIVLAGARRDLGELDAAVVMLQIPELDPVRTGTDAARLFYAYADNLDAAGRGDEALEWFAHAARADVDDDTDADQRLAEMSSQPYGAPR